MADRVELLLSFLSGSAGHVVVALPCRVGDLRLRVDSDLSSVLCPWHLTDFSGLVPDLPQCVTRISSYVFIMLQKLILEYQKGVSDI